MAIKWKHRPNITTEINTTVGVIKGIKNVWPYELDYSGTCP